MKGLHQDPEATKCLGRQPEIRKLTPSKQFPWYGTEVDGRRFTAQQEATCISKGVDPVTVSALLVKRQARRDEVWFSTKVLAPRFEMLCPVIGEAANGRVRVITPNGTTALVQANGWSHHPRRLPDCYRMEFA